MNDFIEILIKERWEDIKSMSFLEWCIVIIIIYLAYVLAMGAPLQRSYGTDLKECIADGHKGYECRGILRGGHGGR